MSDLVWEKHPLKISELTEPRPLSRPVPFLVLCILFDYVKWQIFSSFIYFLKLYAFRLTPYVHPLHPPRQWAIGLNMYFIEQDAIRLSFSNIFS